MPCPPFDSFGTDEESDLLVLRRLFVSYDHLCRCQVRYRGSRVANCCAFRELPRAAAAECRVFEQVA